MTRRLTLALLTYLFLAMPVQAQTVSDAFAAALEEQGFVIESTGYTWLWRTVVHATNGYHDREIVLARGSEQVLQDNWTVVAGATAQDATPPNLPTGGADRQSEGPRGGAEGRGGSGAGARGPGGRN
ncbi:hypothetical protein N9H93_01595 [Rhizobiaceae bacterium]|nr:hypothetical protein [Rhizobiaceae bacterium]